MPPTGYMRQYYLKHRDQQLATQRERYATDVAYRQQKNVASTAWRLAHLDMVKATSRKAYLKRRESPGFKAHNKRVHDIWYAQYRKGNVVKTRANNLRAKYKMSPETYERLHAEQNGVCAICDALPSRLDIDHDHDTGRIRGLLCHTCNTRLGLWDWFVTYQEKIKDYIR